MSVYRCVYSVLVNTSSQTRHTLLIIDICAVCTMCQCVDYSAAAVRCVCAEVCVKVMLNVCVHDSKCVLCARQVHVCVSVCVCV